MQSHSAAAGAGSSSAASGHPLLPPLTPVPHSSPLPAAFLGTPRADAGASALWTSMLALSPGDAAAAHSHAASSAAAGISLHPSLLTPASSGVHPTKQNLFSLMHHSQQQQQQQAQQHGAAAAASVSTPSLDSMLSPSLLTTPLHSAHQSSDGGLALMQHNNGGAGGVAVDDPVHSLLALTPTLPNRSSAFRSAQHAASSSLVGAAATSPVPHASMMNAQLGSPLQLLPPSTSPTSSLLSSHSPMMRRDGGHGLMSDSPAPVSGMPNTRHRRATDHLMARAHIPISPGMQLRGGGGGGGGAASNNASPSPHSQLNPHLRTHELQQAQSAALKHGAHSHAATKSTTIDTPGSTTSSTVSTRSTMRTVFQINGRSGANRAAAAAAAHGGTTVAASAAAVASTHGSGGGSHQHMTAPSSAGAHSISPGSAGSSNGKPQRSCNKKLGFDETAKPLSQQASPKTIVAQQRAADAAAAAAAAAESKMQESAESSSYGRSAPLSARNLAALHTRSLSSTGALLHSPANASATPDLLSPPPIMLAGSSSFFAAPPLMHSSSSTSPPIPGYHHHSHGHHGHHHHSASPASPFMPAASPSPTTLLHSAQHHHHHSVLHRAQHSSTPTSQMQLHRQQHSPSSGMVGGGGGSVLGSPGGPGQLMMAGSGLFSPHFSPSHGIGTHSAVGLSSSSQSHRQSLSQQSSQSPSPAPSSSARDHELPPSTPLASSSQVPQFTTSLALASDKKMATPMPLAATAAAAAAAAASAAAVAAARKESRGARAAPRGVIEQSFESPKPERQSSRVALAAAAAQAAAVEKGPAGAPDSGSSTPAAVSRSYSVSANSGGGGGGGCRGCNCKKSKCLKLYCECFARQGFCNSDCKCHGCQNTPGHSTEREKAITTTLQRDPKAFFRASGALPGPDSASGGGGGALKGCHCKKSQCLKKYCECFQAGVECTAACKCIDCLNGSCIGSHRRSADDDEPAPTARKKAKVGSGGSKAAAAAAAALVAVEKKANGAGGGGGTKRGAAAAALSSEEEEYIQHPQKRGGSGSSGAGAQKKRAKKDHAPAPAVAHDDAADDADDVEHDASILDDSAVSPATSNGVSSLSSSSVPHSGGTAGRPRRTVLSLNVRAQASHVVGGVGGSSFSASGVLGLSFQQQAAAHQKARALAGMPAGMLYHSQPHDHSNSLASDDPDLTDCDQSLPGVGGVGDVSGGGGVVSTPIKRGKNGLKRPAGVLDTSRDDSNSGGMSALETLVEVASPSPRAPHKFHLHTHGGMHPPASSNAAQAAAVAAAANRLSLSRQGHYPSLSSSAALSPLSSNVSTSSSTALTPDRDLHKRHRNLAASSYNNGAGAGSGHGAGHGGHSGATGVHLSGMSSIAVSPYPQLLSPVRRNAASPSIGGIGSPYAGSGLSSSPTHGLGMGASSVRAPHSSTMFGGAPSPLLFHGASLASSSLASHLTLLTPHHRTVTPEGASAGSEDGASKDHATHMHEMAPVAVI